MNLHYSLGTYSLADHIALIESTLPFDKVKVDLKDKRTETGEDFSVINAKGYLPALEIDTGEVLTENIAILSYIADRSGKLIPPSGMARWRVLEMTAFISTELHKPRPITSTVSTLRHCAVSSSRSGSRRSGGRRALRRSHASFTLL